MMKKLEGKQYRRWWLIAAVCLGVVGCAESVPPPKPLTTDQKVLAYLDYYGPVYKLNAQGQVVGLRLGGKVLPAEVMTEVGKLSELRQLDIYGASLAEDSLAQLQDLQRLSSLGIGGTNLTDQGLAHLEKLKGLRFTWIPRANLSDEAIAKLKKALPGAQVYLQ
jgi:hypothetical protein